MKPIVRGRLRQGDDNINLQHHLLEKDLYVGKSRESNVGIEKINYKPHSISLLVSHARHGSHLKFFFINQRGSPL